MPRFVNRPAEVARALVSGALAAAVAATVACGGGDATGPDASSGRAALTVRAVLEAASATAVELRAGYLAADGARVELSTQTVPLAATSAPSATLPQTTMPVDVGRCIADERRAVPGPACSVVLDFRLLRGTTLLDEQSLSATVKPGDALTLQAPAPLSDVQRVRIALGDTAATSVRLEIGDTLRLTATTVDATGAAVAGRTILWGSDTPLVATIDATGRLVGVAPGTATIQAISGARSAAATLTVVPIAVHTIGVAPASVQLSIGGTSQLVATPRDAHGNPLPDRPVLYASSDRTVATVTATGQVRGIAGGSATITIESPEGPNGTTVRASVPVTVTRPPVATLDVSPATVQVAVGGAVPLIVTPRDAAGTALTGLPLTFASANPAIATVAGDGTVRGVAAGATTVTVSSTGGANGATVRADVPVTVTATSTRGVVSGRLVAGPANTPVAGATLRFDAGGTTAATVTSAADGAWSSPSLAVGTYTVAISAPGMQATSIPSLVVTNGNVAIPTIPLTVGDGTTTGSVQVRLRDATTGQPIAVPVTLTVGGGIALAANAVDALTPKTTLTTATGGVLVPSLGNTATLRAQATGYADALAYVAPTAGQTTAVTIALSPTSGVPTQTRIVLTWGADPEDLDSHLTGPTSAGPRFHIFWALPGDCDATPFACLDVDETSGFGPETISISQGVSGTYHYAVNHFHGAGTLATSGARVDVYVGGVLARTFTPPAGTGAWWNVFDIVDGAIVPVNTYGATAPSVIFPRGSVMPVKRRKLR